MVASQQNNCKDNTELFKLVIPTQKSFKIDEKSTAEIQIGCKMTTVKAIKTMKPQMKYNVSEIDDNI